MKFNITNKDKKGFTLIELLVVIAIIGLLSSILLGTLNTARAKGRDAKRIADLRQLSIALEVYFTEFGRYPMTFANPTTLYWGSCTGENATQSSGVSGWIPNLAPAYIRVLPTDPNQVGDCYRYVSPDGTNYMVMAGTNETYPASSNPLRRITQPSNFAIYSPSPGPRDVFTAPYSY